MTLYWKTGHLLIIYIGKPDKIYVDKILYRKVQKDIEKWLNDEHDALLITGARQVGKSFLIRETLKKNKIDYVEFNIVHNPNLLEIFNSALNNDSDRFLMEL